jgi:osmotically-inducible protein OsmY
MASDWNHFRVRVPRRHYRPAISAGMSPGLGGVLSQQLTSGSGSRSLPAKLSAADQRDEYIAEEVRFTLEQAGLLLPELSISVTQGEVWLQGAVEDLELKKKIEGYVEHLPGVQDVMNLLQVDGPAHSPY